MSYVKKRLFEGETIEYKGRFHWLHIWTAWFALVTLGVFLIGIYIFIKIMVHINTTEFVVTSRRVIFKRGFFNSKMDELELDAIEGGHTQQSFWGRVFGYGDVQFTGRGDSTIDFPDMALPGQFIAAAEKARVKAQNQPFDDLARELHEDHAARRLEPAAV